MAEAKKGDTVKVHYTGKLTNGNVFDSSIKKEPIQFTIGEKKLIPGFEEAVIDMKPGDKKTITIPSEEAYGPHRQELVITIDRKDIPTDINPEVGQILQFQKKDGSKGNDLETIPFTVIATTTSHITLDANHPLSGKDLVFEVELLEIL